MSREEASALGALRHTLAERSKRPGVELDVLGVGEACLDDVWVLDGKWQRGGKLRARRQTLGGGQVATALVAAARLGRRAAFAGAVGDDAEGARVLDGLAAEGVDVSAARRVPGATRATMILVEHGGERTILEHVDARVHPLAGDAHAADHVDGALAAALDRACLVHLDAAHLTASLRVARLARARGVPVSLDVDAAQPDLDELLELADVCITSEELPRALTGEHDLAAALRGLAGSGTRALTACTLGAHGSAALVSRPAGDRLLLEPAFTVDAVDTTACGDVFRAAVLCALFDGRSLAETLRFANAAAALKCRDLGRRGSPTRAEVDALLSS
jgi:sugar/nucleoside kinase (ribokinase family)